MIFTVTEDLFSEVFELPYIEVSFVFGCCFVFCPSQGNKPD